MVSARGFTLVELTIVIAIIGVLASVIVVAIDIPNQLKKARDGARKSNLRNIQSALELYRTDAGCYPGNGTCSAMPACGNPLTWTSGSATSTYMQKIPCDPKSGWTQYSYTPSGDRYTLTACLERSIDPEANGSACGDSNSGKQYSVNNP